MAGDSDALLGCRVRLEATLPLLASWQQPRLYVPRMENAVLRALIDCLVLIGLSADDVIDPDYAVRALEEAAHTLGSLAEPERQRLAESMLALADEESGERRVFVRGLPRALGLIPD